ncbi:aconitate hydratase [Streptomyces diacarni]|uniref:3-isopropylmalate dehydratase small subunit n=1 Tax=Streptomyces diacarni TaxID=2800381 RepID=A0A367F2Y9_9ACTN|nr:aconitate hydratase [Streptomyces diacarni]RCG24734.1 aconitate hydratase [Streptomyces diacarni]
MTTITGRVWLFGDDLNTDVIHPPQFFSLDEEKVRAGLFHGLDPGIQPRLRPGDVLVGGHNFGCGSSRETSVRSLKLNGIGALIALDFARIFFRNCTNNGIPCLTLARARDLQALRPGQVVNVDPEQARMTTEEGEEIPLDPPGGFVQRIWQAGGLLALLPDSRPERGA